VRLGRNVKRYIRQAPVSHWLVGLTGENIAAPGGVRDVRQGAVRVNGLTLPDETRTNTGSVRVVRAVRVFGGKSPHGENDTQIHACVARAGPIPTSFSYTDTLFYPDDPDDPDGASNGAGLRRQGGQLYPDGALTGDLCRRCSEPMAWPAPVGVIYADGSAEHHECRFEKSLERTATLDAGDA
jgi:hypothetical protein